MPTLYDIKPAFVRSLDPAISFCARRGITPNALTAAALALSVGMGAVLAFFPKERLALGAVAAFFLLRMALNAMDGALARRTGQSTPEGEVFNEVADVLADSVLYLPLIFVSSASPIAVVLFAFLAAMSELCGVLPKTAGFARRYDGPLGKSDRALAVGLYLVAVAAGVPRGGWETVFFALLDALLVLTCANRLRKGLAR
jgi:CDP-diacylglycerol--glycerol-3-phosphate 3-phosphatidyltransferase